MRIIAFIAAIIIAAAGGALAYHAFFIEPSKTEVVNTGAGTVRELPNMLHLLGGLLMLIVGASLAFLSTRRR